ncbi:MAG: FtsX-like permease family protein, partial [Bacteroidota bacterium]
RQLNLKNPVGKYISWVNNDHPTKRRVPIIGVVGDFHFRSLHEEIQPLAIQCSTNDVGHILVKMEGQQFQQTLTQLQMTYEAYEQELPFEFSFLDDQLATLYEQEITTLNVFAIFAGLALLLAGLGLLGMAIAMMNQKVKEVGIRKILGASMSQIILLIIGQFSRLITVALLIGLPTGLLLMQSWLSEFSYRVAPGWLPFVAAAVILFTVAAVSVSFVVVRIAQANPVDAVRDE